MNKYILNVLHQEPLDSLSLEHLTGGKNENTPCTGGATFSCKCYGKDQLVYQGEKNKTLLKTPTKPKVEPVVKDRTNPSCDSVFTCQRYYHSLQQP